MLLALALVATGFVVAAVPAAEASYTCTPTVAGEFFCYDLNSGDCYGVILGQPTRCAP